MDEMADVCAGVGLGLLLGLMAGGLIGGGLVVIVAAPMPWPFAGLVLIVLGGCMAVMAANMFTHVSSDIKRMARRRR